ncbi:MAG: peptide chain release factor N(5)-glutamine methyltransferase [Bacteroidaceae bacterium]|nr:peptide chain release factor N(5)-glutamine methyltransferase [Bacteroidaceae bacterium]
MNILQDIARRLQAIYPSGEARAVARILLEDGFLLSQTDILLGKDSELSAEQRCRLEKCVQRLLAGEPVQYVTGTCFFLGRPFSVRPGCLIPRPETEDLVAAIVNFVKQHPNADKQERPLRILDIGTGSGCIAVSLASELGASAQVEAWDISTDALAIARENAEKFQSTVSFQQVDVLKTPDSSVFFDLIVSNPPYVRELEKADMEANVLEHEPALALFVPDDDPLLFYRSIANYAFRHLTPGGTLWFETNRYLITDTAQLLKRIGFPQIETITDRFGHPRHLKAIRP